MEEDEVKAFSAMLPDLWEKHRLYQAAGARVGIPSEATAFASGYGILLLDESDDDGVALETRGAESVLETWTGGEREETSTEVASWSVVQRALGAVATALARDPEVAAAIPPFAGPGIEVTTELVEEIMSAPKEAGIPQWVRTWAMLRLADAEPVSERIHLEPRRNHKSPNR